MALTRIAIFGAGFWSQFQIAGWRELPGVEVVAIYNRTRAKAEALAARFGIDAVYDDPEALIRKAHPDAVDVITDVDTHARFVELAASHGVDVISQKPMAPELPVARRMVEVCREANVRFAVHENWRWQRPIRELKKTLDSGIIGRPFRARIQYSSSFPVFENQPFLKDLEQFILTDMGSHILDVARFLFGEAQSVYARTARVHPDIRGEDVATVMLGMGDLTCTCEISYASRLEHERFPEAFILIEGTLGSLELALDYWVRTTTAEGTFARRVPPPRYAWADPAYDLVHASIVDCNRNILAYLQGGPPAETTGADNLRTMELVFASYESARTGRAIELGLS